MHFVTIEMSGETILDVRVFSHSGGPNNEALARSQAIAYASTIGAENGGNDPDTLRGLLDVHGKYSVGDWSVHVLEARQHSVVSGPGHTTYHH